MELIDNIEYRSRPHVASHTRRCQGCSLRSIGICKVLSNDALAEFQKISRRKFIKDGDMIFHEADETKYFYSIIFGAVKLFKNLHDGQEHIVELLYAPALLGEHLVPHHTYSAQAASDVELCYYPKKPFENFISEHKEFGQKVFEMAIFELELSRNRTLILARKNSLERVASFVVLSVQAVRGVGCGQIIDNAARVRLPFTRGEMADYLGLTLETVSRQLSILRKREIIEIHSWRDIIVPDITALMEVASLETTSKNQKDSRVFA